MWKAAHALTLSQHDRALLTALVRGGQTPQRAALRARIILGAADGRANHRLAKELGISRPKVLRWRQRFTEAGVVGLSRMRPVQALDRTAPVLPLRPGIPARQTHDDIRHGTTTLFAAPNVLDGTVIGRCKPRHRHVEFIEFLDQLDRSTSRRVELHLIWDNYRTRKHPRVVAWLAAHPRFTLHFIPTSSSWLNLVERWFGEMTRKRIRNRTFRSVPELTKAIYAYLRETNKAPAPSSGRPRRPRSCARLSIVTKRWIQHTSGTTARSQRRKS